MALVQVNWKPDDKTLREFSEIWLIFFGMIFMPLALFKGHPQIAATLWGIALLGRLVGWLKPQWMKPVFLGMTLASWPIGWAISHLAMALIFYGVFTPLALFFRLIGRDALRRKLDKSAATYWEPYNPDRGKARYLKQF
jgi:hypothetical protein